LVRLSLVYAIVAAAGPYVGRPVRRLGYVTVAGVAVSSMYLGVGFPKEVLGGLVLGWGVAAAVHLLFGSPGGRPTRWQLEMTLPLIGINATNIRLTPNQPSDGTMFVAEDETGPLRVKVIGRDEVDAQLLVKAWRFLAYKEPAPPLYLTRGQQVEHEAAMTLLARSAGVQVPQVVFVGKAGPNAALLVLRGLPFRRLTELDLDEVTDTVLQATWSEVGRLHHAHITHGALDADHIVVTAQGPALVAFTRASTGDFERRRGRDVAELLTATAAIVGEERAVTACVAIIGQTGLVAAIPFLQPAAIRRQTRSALGTFRNARDRLDELRRRAAEAVEVDAPQLQNLQRFKASSVLLTASSLIAIGALLNQVGNPSHVWDTTQNAAWGWLAAALALSLATNLAYAVALMGTLPLRLPLWPTTELQVAMSYSNLVIPVIGGTGFQIRFLQRQGAELPAAIAAGGLLSTAGTVLTQIPLFVLAIWLSPDSLDLGSVPVSGIMKSVAIVVVVLGVITAVTLGVPRLRRTVLPPVREVASTIWTAVRSRRQLALIIGGNVAVTVLYGICLLCCVRAFGGSLSFWTAMAITIAIGTLAALIPIPGGGTAFGSIGVAGVLIALRAPTQVAVAAALANQLVVNYLPAAPGWFATRRLLRNDYL
jgi:undecaprenyl-diphosphatase